MCIYINIYIYAHIYIHTCIGGGVAQDDARGARIPHSSLLLCITKPLCLCMLTKPLCLYTGGGVAQDDAGGARIPHTFATPANRGDDDRNARRAGHAY